MVTTLRCGVNRNGADFLVALKVHPCLQPLRSFPFQCVNTAIFRRDVSGDNWYHIIVSACSRDTDQRGDQSGRIIFCHFYDGFWRIMLLWGLQQDHFFRSGFGRFFFDLAFSNKKNGTPRVADPAAIGSENLAGSSN